MVIMTDDKFGKDRKMNCGPIEDRRSKCCYSMKTLEDTAISFGNSVWEHEVDGTLVLAALNLRVLLPHSSYLLNCHTELNEGQLRAVDLVLL
jgi:hypothetical protein